MWCTTRARDPIHPQVIKMSTSILRVKASIPILEPD